MLPLRDWGLLDLVTPDLPVTSQLDLLAAPGYTPGNSVVRVASSGEALFLLVTWSIIAAKSSAWT